MFEASRSFLGGIRDIQKRLIFGIVDAANLHIFEKDALRLGEDHFSVLALVDGINHGLSDFARLTARNGTVRRICERQRRLNTGCMAGYARHLRVNESVDLDVFEGKKTE